jgi:hypothetical protein
MLMLLAFQQNAKEHVVLEPEGKQITLTGRISLVHGYGPPGWGEDRKHDAHITYWVIDLPNAINTPCTPERPEWKAIDCQSTKRLRLIVEDDDHHLAEARASQGQTAAVDGILHRADTAGEITPIYVEVKEIKLLK